MLGIQNFMIILFLNLNLGELVYLMTKIFNNNLDIFLLFAAAEEQNKEWAGKWFPTNPNEITVAENSIKTTSINSNSETWKGKWLDFILVNEKKQSV